MKKIMNRSTYDCLEKAYLLLSFMLLNTTDHLLVNTM